MELETVWHGATWRSFAPPQMLVQTQPPVRGSNYKGALLAVLHDGWQEVKAVKAKAAEKGVPVFRVRDYLARLTEDGRVEARTVTRRDPVSLRNHTYHFYRRRRTEAAA